MKVCRWKSGRPTTNPKREDPLEKENLCFLGSNVASGTGSGVAIQTGKDTYFGSLAQQHRWAAGADQLRQGHHPVHLADDRFHGDHGAAGLPDQWDLQA